MKKLIQKTSSILFASILLLSCATKKEIDSNQQLPQLNGVWELASISGIKNLDKDFSEQLPTLIFENKEGLIAFGNDGCNQYQTEITVKKNQILEINPAITTTRMICKKVNSSLYLENLAKVNSYEISENVLKLNTPSDTLKFNRVSLEGKWVLDKLNTVKKKVNDLYPYKKPFLNININSNQVTGNTACNSITAQILIFENKMSFKHVLTTKMFCDGTGEKDFTDALARTTNYELKGTRLLLLENDKIIMEFKR